MKRKRMDIGFTAIFNKVAAMPSSFSSCQNRADRLVAFVFCISTGRGRGVSEKSVIVLKVSISIKMYALETIY